MASLSRRTFLGWVAAAGLTGCAANKLPGEAAPSSASSAAESIASTATVADPVGVAAADTTVAAAVAEAPVTVAPATTPPASAAPPTPAPGQPAWFINHGARDSGKVALTFHAAGSVSKATALLDLLKKSGTPVTVFAVGNWIEANPQLANRMVSDGHEVANHTWSHGAMRTMSATQLVDEISRAGKALTTAIGSNGRWFRPSQIEVPTDQILAAAGKAGYGVSVGYDLDSMDFQDPGAAAVKANVIGHVQSGSIVSLHFDHQNTIEALPAILDHLKSKKLTPVTITQLIG